MQELDEKVVLDEISIPEYFYFISNSVKEPKEGMMFWFKRVNSDTFISSISNVFRYVRIAELDEEIDDDGNHILVARHQLGPKGSSFLSSL